MTQTELLEKISTYKEHRFCGYQGWDKIGLKAQRPTEKRLDIYNLNKILTPDSVVLDVGCNIGCLSMQLAETVKEVHGVDDAPYLIEQANLIKDFLQLKNVYFHYSNIAAYNLNMKFDLILHLAADFDGPIEFQQYAKRLRDMLKDDGYLIFESHGMPTWKTQFDCFTTIFEEMGLVQQWRGSIQDDTRNTLREYVVFRVGVPSNYPYGSTHSKACIKEIPQYGRIIWFTGRSGVGKSELALLVYKNCKNFILLDGDDMQNTICHDLFYGKEDKVIFNWRIAGLAKVLTSQKYNVAIANICASQIVRNEIDEAMKCEWVYVRRDDIADWTTERELVYPFIPPTNPSLVLDMTDYKTHKLLFADAFPILMKELKLEKKENQ